jgi:response regulator RpfG family c-di-GMP phosphodiesterase
MRPLLPEWTATRERRPVPPSAAATVFVVDDEPQIRELLASALRRESYTVTVFDDARRALAALEHAEPDLLITDLRMPAMNGLELIKAAKALRPNLGSILITAFASTETAVEALRRGADDYLRKPFGLDDLRRVVSRVLDAGRMARDEQAAVRRVRSEADTLRARSRAVEADLRRTREDLDVSRLELERRVRDLEFVRELTGLLAREDDVDRMLRTTARILGLRFDAHVARIEVDLGDGVHTAEIQQSTAPLPVLRAMGPALLHRARLLPDGIMRDTVLGYGAPMEALAVVVRLAEQPVGGVTLLRPVPQQEEEAADGFLLSLVPQAMAVALEGEVNRRAAERNALRVAERIIEALEGRGSLFQGHARRVSRLAGAVAEQIGLSPRLRRVIEMAARLHDVGAVGIPDDVMKREGPLSDSERSIVRLHPVIGAQILAPFGEAAAFVRHHHERPDGRGYPDRLRADQIPVGAGVIGVAEAYDAMTSARPYRRSLSRRAALDEIRRNTGTQFHEAAADALLGLAPERL